MSSDNTNEQADFQQKQGCLRVGLRWTVRIIVALVLLVCVTFCVTFAGPLYHYFYLFPKQKAAWKELETKRTPVALKTGWNEYRGILHCHSEISHDSLMKYPDILEAMHQAKCQFIFVTDHTVDGKADFSLGWNGMHDGVLFVHGYEMNQGVMPWGLPASTVLNASDPAASLAKQIRQLGGVMCYAHCEEKRDWDVPELDGMEIYNIHSDLLLNLHTKRAIWNLIKEVLINHRTYPEQTLRTTFHRSTLNLLLRRYDEQCAKHGKLTAIAANDCHNNCGFRAIYTDHDTLFVIDTGHDDPEHKIAEWRLNGFTRSIARMCFGPLQPGREVFRFDLDPYARMSRVVNTYLLANELTEPALLDAIRAGRAYVGFTMIADPSGFAYVAEGTGKKVTMGDRISLSPDLKLRAATPLPCRFNLVLDGKRIKQQDGSTFEFSVKKTGKYRIEAEINVLGKWIPWIYANPIEVTPAGA